MNDNDNIEDTNSESAEWKWFEFDQSWHSLQSRDIEIEPNRTRRVSCSEDNAINIKFVILFIHPV